MNNVAKKFWYYIAIILSVLHTIFYTFLQTNVAHKYLTRQSRESQSHYRARWGAAVKLSKRRTFSSRNSSPSSFLLAARSRGISRNTLLFAGALVVPIYPPVYVHASLCARTHPFTQRAYECLEWRAPRMVVSTRVITCLVHHKARTWPDVICRGPRKTRPTSQRFNTRPRAVGSLSKCRKSNYPRVHRFIIWPGISAGARIALRCIALHCVVCARHC